jgi:hypothetical protein
LAVCVSLVQSLTVFDSRRQCWQSMSVLDSH